MEVPMRSRLRLLRTLLAVLLFSATVVGCGPDDEGTAAATSPPPAPTPGTVTLDVSGITDAPNLVMLAVIGNNMPNQAFAAACAIVDADPFSFTGEFFPITGDDPCSLGTDPVEFDPGPYEVIVAVMQGGARSPEQCAQTSVTVDGDVTVEVAALGPPTGCDF
jgi:hypothetical protein